MSTEHPDIRALQREWKIGLFVVIGGFTLAIAIAAFLTFGKKPHAVVPDQTQVAEPAPPSGDAANGLNDPSQVCSTALANAKNFGVLPMTGHLRDPDPRLLATYAAFRATLRARICVAHLIDPDPMERQRWPGEARRYLALAAEECLMAEG